jgi:peroxiredoxin
MDRQETWEAARGLRAGDLAPEFRLRDGKGEWVSLSATLGEGPAVVVFLSPACAAQAGPAGVAWWWAEAAALGARLLAISSGGVGAGLCDADGAVGRAYGAPETAGVATYVVERDGRIVLSCVEARPAGGLQLGEALAALKALRARDTGP